MITAALAALGFLLVAAWGLLALRGRVRLLAGMRRLHGEVRALRDDLEARLDALEDACHVAGLAPPEGGSKPSDAADRLVELTESLRRADDEFEAFEAAWSEGQFTAARERLMAGLQKVDGSQGWARRLAIEVDKHLERFASDPGWRALEELASREWKATGEVLAAAAAAPGHGALADPGFRMQLLAHAESLAEALDRTLVARRQIVAAGADPLERVEAAKRAALALARLIGFKDHIPGAGAIQARVGEQLPRVLGEAHDALDGTGDRLLSQLRAIESLGREAETALERGDLWAADVLGRRAVTGARNLARWFAVGIVDAPTWGGRGIAGTAFAVLESALLPPVGTLAAFGVSLLLGAGLGGAIGHALTGSSEVMESQGNLALDRPAAASSELDAAHGAAMAFDGDPATAWESGESLQDPQWITVDLRHLAPIHAVEVLPLAAPRSSCLWAADVSTDGSTWRTLGQATSLGAPQHSAWGRVVAPRGTLARLVRVRPIDWGKSGVGIEEIRVFAPPRIAR